MASTLNGIAGVYMRQPKTTTMFILLLNLLWTQGSAGTVHQGTTVLFLLHLASVWAAPRLEAGAIPNPPHMSGGLRWGCWLEHLHTAFLQGLGFLTTWRLVSKARVPRE